MLAEQAIFTSTQTERAEGYQLVAASPGLCAEDRQELSMWGPSHDSLANEGPQGASVNFFPLARGSYCVSKTTAHAGEYSGRAGARVYTQCLVVTPETLARFANNPFAVLRAAAALGALQPLDTPPLQLEPLRLVGRCAPVDHALLTDLLHDPGVPWLAGALAHMLAQPKLGIAVPAAQTTRLLAGLFNCLPPACRAEFSFTTGLRWSARRPFRILCTSDDPAEIRRVERQQGPVFSLLGQSIDADRVSRGWPGYIAEVLQSGRTSTLTTQLAKSPAGLSAGSLDAWGEQLLAEFRHSGKTAPLLDPPARAPANVDAVEPDTDSAATISFPRLAAVTPPSDVDALMKSQRLSSLLGSASMTPTVSQLDLLDVLDDAVFDAIGGKTGALDQLRKLWPQAMENVSSQVLDESRDHYVRQALAAWHQQRHQRETADPVQAVAMLDVLSVVLEESAPRK